MQIQSILALVLLTFGLLEPCGGYSQAVQFAQPLRGSNGHDYVICRYVDHDSTSDVQDAFCGTKTYDGHTGTDYLIGSYKAMDSGVYVYAVADGRVFQAIDGNYDRMKTLKRDARPNSIGVIHKEKLCTYYYHLKKNSLLVKFGDSVKCGQAIAMVGSSGYSTSPHLHFEVRDSNNIVIDPFIGKCSPEQPPLWISQPVYDLSLIFLEDGFVPYVPDFNQLMERQRVSDTFYMGTDEIACYWVLAHGFRKGQVMTAEWYTPAGRLWSVHSYKWDVDQWFNYTWPHIDLPNREGKWLVKLFVDRKLFAHRNFYILESPGK